MAVGIDIVSVARVERLVRTYGRRFIERWFTTAEIDLCSAACEPAVDYAAHLAGKEAVVKTLGLAPDTAVPWHDIEMQCAAGGGAAARLRGDSLAAAQHRGITTISVSVASSGEWAVATAIASMNSTDQGVLSDPGIHHGDTPGNIRTSTPPAPP